MLPKLPPGWKQYRPPEKKVVSCGPGDLVAKVMEERGVSGNSRDYVLFYGDGAIIDRHGKVAKFEGGLTNGIIPPRLVHKKTLWRHTDPAFAKQYWHNGRSV